MCIGAQANRIDPHRTVDVLQSLLAKIGEIERDLASNLPISIIRKVYAARFGDALKSRSDVDTVPENVIGLDQDVAEIDPDPVQHTPVFGYTVVPLGHQRLHG